MKRIHKRVSAIKGSEEIGVKYMQAWEEKAYEREEGREEGRAEGELRKVLVQIQRKAAKNLEVATISEHLEESEEFVGKVCGLIQEHPDASVEELVTLAREVL